MQSQRAGGLLPSGATQGKDSMMRSPIWFVVAGVIVIASLAGAVLYLLPRLESAGAGLVRVVVPGNSELTLDKPGTYKYFCSLHPHMTGTVVVQ